MNEQQVGLLGATSLTGQCLIRHLIQNDWRITAFSRQSIAQDALLHRQISWQQLDRNKIGAVSGGIPNWICAAPIWILPGYFDFLAAHGVRRIVALSSTSRFTKDTSSDPHERKIAQKLAHSEILLQTWASAHAIEYVILRPTLIYGYGRDKNITEIAKFIRRFGFFPLLGGATGLRQPIHVEDVALACFFALSAFNLKNRSYNVAGGEALPYRDMVKRIFEKLDRQPRMPTIPLWLFQFAVRGIGCLPRYRHLTFAMAERMNRDLQFDYSDARRDLHFSPRPFNLTTEDLYGANEQN